MPILKNRFLIALLILVLIILTGGGAYIHLQPSSSSKEPGLEQEEKKDLFAGFSGLVLNTAHARDNFQLNAVKRDNSGVESASSYILTSKQRIDPEVLKDNLEVDPGFEYKIKEINKKKWRITPEKPLQPNTVVNFSLSTIYQDENGEKKEKDYSWAYQIKDNFKVLHTIPGEAGTNVPLDTGIEVTFSHENFQNYESHFSIEPQVEGRFEKHGRTVVFVPRSKLESGALYTIKIKKGLGVKNSDNRLQKDHSFTFETDFKSESQDNKYRIHPRDKMMEINTETAPLIQISGWNAPPEANVELYEFRDWEKYLNTIKKRDKLPWWSRGKEKFSVDTSELPQINSFQASIRSQDNEKFIQFPEELPAGFYLAELNHPNGNESQVWIQVSNIAIYYNITKTDSLVWVNSIPNSSPVSGAQVEIIGQDGSFTTNVNGISRFQTPQKIISRSEDTDESERYYFKISNQDNVLILPASKITRNFWWSEPKAADEYWNYLYTDRPQYRTSDTIQFWGLLKDRREEGIKEDVTVTLYKQGYLDYYYKPVKIKQKEIKLSSMGSFQGKMDFENLRPDYYTLELEVGDKLIKKKYIDIEPYTKPAYELNLNVDKHLAFAGEEIDIKGKANFFEGTPVPDLDLVFKTPEGEEIVTTDEDGEVDLSYTKEYSSCQRDYGCWPKYANISLKPQKSEVGEIEAGTFIKFYSPKVYVNTKTEYPDKGEAEINFTSKYLDLDSMDDSRWWHKSKGEEVAPNIKIEGEMIKITHEKKLVGTEYDFINKETYKQYRYERHEEKVDDFSFRTDSKGDYTLKQKVSPETSYRVKYRIYDEEGHYDTDTIHLYYYDGKDVNQYSNWSYNNYRFELKKDENKFSFGDRVQATFVNNDEPMPSDRGDYLFLQMQNGLREYETKSDPVYDFEFEQTDAPNVDIFGVYFNGSSYIKTNNYGYGGGSGKSINFDTDDKRLKIDVTPDQKEYEPGEKVDLSIKVTDKDDDPVKAEVNLNLVDEAYYALVEDTATPLSTLYSNVDDGSLFSRQTHDILKKDSTVEGGGCFVAGTKVLMANGERKNIEDIEVGDKVKTFKNPLNRKLDTGTVQRTWRRSASEYLVINDKIKVTPEHQVFVNDQFKQASLIRKGDWLLTSQGEKIRVRSITLEKEIIPVYNLKIEPQNTYFAAGVYVHNAEKGGGAREFFTDAALFKVVTTDRQGRATVEFTLPDNITSWRVTSQAISEDMGAGVNISNIPVSLPVFAKANIGKNYLKQDRPTAKLRAYGDELENGDEVVFNVKAPSLGIEEPQTLSAESFEPTYFTFPELKVGQHDVWYDLDTKKGEDSLKLPMKVISSRLQKMKTINKELTATTTIEAPNDLPFALILSDKGQNKLYPYLEELSWSWGDRLDQKYTRVESRELLNKYYDQKDHASEFKSFNYQTSQGGLSLLPYSNADPELSVRVALTGAEEFDKNSLAQFFFEKLKNESSNKEEVSLALSGLAALNKPVLTRIDTWLQRDDLDVKERLYLALGLDRIGAKERSQEIYNEIMKQNAEIKDPYIIVRVPGENDNTFKATALAAVLAASLNTEEAEGLFNYLTDHQKLHGKDKNSERLFKLEKFNYIKKTLPDLQASPAQITYKLRDREETIELTGGDIHALKLEPEEAEELNFTSITGDMGMAIRYIDDFDRKEAQKHNSLSLRREYYVNGEQTTEFSENETVQVRLYPKFGSKALRGDYQLTDVLASGLTPVTRIYQGGHIDCNYWYPYNAQEQKVKYRVNKNWQNNYCGADYLYYYARVKTPGSYRVEPAILQSYLNPDYINYSDASRIKINPSQ